MRAWFRKGLVSGARLRSRGAAGGGGRGARGELLEGLGGASKTHARLRSGLCANFMGPGTEAGRKQSTKREKRIPRQEWPW